LKRRDRHVQEPGLGWPEEVRGLRGLRITIQLGVLAFFLFLVFANSYPSAFDLPVDLFMRLDPYASLSAMLAARSLIVRLWPLLLVVGSALLLGRVFCGYFCPLGTMLDIFSRVFRGKGKTRSYKNLHAAKYLILFGTLAAAAAGVSIAHFFDPVNIAERTGILLFRQGASVLVAGIAYVPGLADLAAPLEDSLAFEVRSYSLSVLMAAIFACVLALEFVSRRFWCRYLCPLGAMISLLGSIAPFARRVSSECNLCGKCQRDCPFGTVGEDPHRTVHGECTRCYRCSGVCPTAAISFGFGRKEGERLLPGRRAAVLSIAAGAAYGIVGTQRAEGGPGADRVVRPPGAIPEREFLARCTRCGACVGACLTGGLQHSLLEAGFEGVWTPVLRGRSGGCEYECNLCGKVCNSRAIRYMPLEEKQEAKMGTAMINTNLCLAWQEERLCYICDEICPSGAVDFKAGEGDVEGEAIEKPRVLVDKCTGCGLCEWKCPTSPAAIFVTPKGALRS
jgi:polyferredoxin